MPRRAPRARIVDLTGEGRLHRASPPPRDASPVLEPNVGLREEEEEQNEYDELADTLERSFDEPLQPQKEPPTHIAPPAIEIDVKKLLATSEWTRHSDVLFYMPALGTLCAARLCSDGIEHYPSPCVSLELKWDLLGNFNSSHMVFKYKLPQQDILRTVEELFERVTTLRKCEDCKKIFEPGVAKTSSICTNCEIHRAVVIKADCVICQERCPATGKCITWKCMWCTAAICGECMNAFLHDKRAKKCPTCNRPYMSLNRFYEN